MRGPADVRAFYAALGIELPGWAQHNATIRCFADPASHAHEDRNPSCSVSLEHGAWQCWACGAKGGAYTAALATGHTPASAFDLLVRYGLADGDAPRGRGPLRREPAPRSRRATLRQPLGVTDAEVRTWHEALLSMQCNGWREQLGRERLWSTAVIQQLELGHDGSRITIPIRGAAGELHGVLRYRPAVSGRKMLALPGTQLGLIPHPARETSTKVLLVEGPPDMIAARSQGWPAIAVPGDHAWRPQWAELLTARSVVVVMDSDAAGRAAAERIANDLRPLAQVRVVDLAPDRHDGYDLTNWLLERPSYRRQRCRAFSSPKPTITR